MSSVFQKLAFVLFTFSLVSVSLSLHAKDEKAPEAEVKELDMSGLSKFHNESPSNSPFKIKASCTSRTLGVAKAGDAGFEECMREHEQSKFRGDSNKAQDRDNPFPQGPSLQFSN